jgi:hypothetical protein
LIEKAPVGVILDSSPRKIKRKKYPTFDLPEIVLDLDAEDSPHVRPFDEVDAAQQRVKWGYNPIIPEVEERVAQLEVDMRHDYHKMRYMSKVRHHSYKTTDLDVLSVALLGGQGAASSPADGESAGVKSQSQRCDILLKGRDHAINANGIPQRILDGDANTIINFLLHRQRLASSSRETASASTKSGDSAFDTFEGAVQRCKTLWRLERLFVHSLPSGPVSPTSMDHIATQLLKFEDDGAFTAKDRSQHALKFINNLTMRQLSAGIDLSQTLSRLGLVVAARLGLLSAIIQYLQICLSQGFINDASQYKIKKLDAIGDGIIVALEGGDGSARGTRPELFTLVTGRSLAESTVQPSLFGSSLGSTHDYPHTHRIYVQLLGQLGAYRLLWHSWKRGAGDIMRSFEPFYYAAFIRCAEVLHGAKNVAGLDCTTATGDVEMDAQLDLRAIDALDAHHASSTSSKDPYSSRISDPPSWDEINEVFRNSDIRYAAERINALITSACSEPTEDKSNGIESL